MPFGMGFVELALILVVVVVAVVFGATKLPAARARPRRESSNGTAPPSAGRPPHLVLQRTSPRLDAVRWLLLGRRSCWQRR